MQAPLGRALKRGRAVQALEPAAAAAGPGRRVVALLVASQVGLVVKFCV